VAPLLSDEHFSVDGTLIKAWASMKSFQPKPTDAPPDDGAAGDPPAAAPDRSADQRVPQDPQTAEQADPQPAPEPAPETAPMPKPARRDRNAEVDFRGERRSNATHASTTDPDARLFRKSRGTGAVLCFMGHTFMENRNGLIVQAELTHADGQAERRAALEMIHRHSPGSTRRLTLGADKGYDSADFVAELRQACVSPRRRAAPPSTAAPPGTRATPSLRSGAKRSTSPSVGPRPSVAWRRPSCAASTGSAPASPSPWRPTTSHGCPSCWRPEPGAGPTPGWGP
jgi:hypothetical protein